MSDSTEKIEIPETANKNEYARFLKEMGNYVITVDGVDWYLYNGFIMPAHLPHCCPPINRRTGAQHSREIRFRDGIRRPERNI